MSQPDVTTIVLNNRRREDTLACLDSLQKSSYRNNKIILLDVGPDERTLREVRSAYPSVHIIELTANLGYAGNNNIGIKAALEQGADWVFVLNEDTVIDSDCLSLLVQAGEGDDRMGILGPMVYHYDEPDIIQSAGGKLSRYWDSLHFGQNELDQGQFGQPRQVDWISGCALMVRCPMIAEVGVLDERFFSYKEDTEWCLRARKKGWKVGHVPRAKIWHKGVQRNYQPQPMVTYYMTRNTFLMLKKHNAPLAPWIFAWGRTLRTLISWTVRPKWRSMRKHRKAMRRGIVDFLNRHWGERSFL